MELTDAYTLPEDSDNPNVMVFCKENTTSGFNEEMHLFPEYKSNLIRFNHLLLTFPKILI